MENNAMIGNNEMLVDLENEETQFSINDDNTADWALRKIADARKELDRLKSIADRQILEIQLKIKNEEEAVERKTSFLKNHLANYFDTVERKVTKTQESYKLLSGSLIKKNASQKMIKNDDDLLNFFHENNMQEYIKTEEKPAWAEFKKNCSIVDGKVIDTLTGIVVEVVKVEEVPEVFDIKL